MASLPRARRSFGLSVALLGAIALSAPAFGTAAPSVLSADRALPAAASASAALPAADSSAQLVSTLDRDTAHTVTLVTGDVVRISGGATGTISVDPVSATETFAVHHLGSDAYVIPSSAAPLIAAGTLDRELFNVTLLDQMGKSTVPLIIQQTPGSSRAKGVNQGRPGRAGAQLESIHAVAWSAPAKDAPRLWTSLTDPAPAPAGVSAPAPSGESVRLASGVAKVWLDAPVSAADEVSTPQIGAPASWEAGYDGTGQVIAVLDTGIDSTHPDFTGRIDTVKNFTPEADGTDHHGHGTHVASIAAGKGPHPGVAPGAHLIIGKVLDTSGSGEMSWIVDGMEWAAGQHPDVINMSLGSDRPSDGSDPISQALNSLSEQDDVLFVVAAGNDGPGSSTIGSPAAADLALTVGNVDANDQLAWSSSRGPRIIDGAIKPELTAPGTMITAARAAGTTLGSPVDALYTQASGTSMASPHVAGSVALLHQRRPDLDPAALKAALASTAKRIDGQTAYEQGSGRLDAGRAVLQQVYATRATVDFGKFEWPNADTPAADKTITYRNDTTAPVTLQLSATMNGSDGSDVSSLVSLSADSLTVAAGGTASVTATFDTPSAAPDLYSGYLAASSADGSVVLSTALGAYKEDELYTIRATALDREGRPARSSQFALFDVNDSENGYLDLTVVPDPDTGLMLLEVPAGTYSFMGLVGTPDDKVDRGDIALLGDPELEVTGDLTVTYDARQAHYVKVKVDQDSNPHERSATIGYYRKPVAGPSLTSQYLHIGGLVSNTRSALATDTVHVGRFEFDTSVELVKQDIAISLGRRDLPVEYALGSPTLDGRHSYRLVDIGTATEPPAGVDLRGAAVIVHPTDPVPILDALGQALAARGASVLIASIEPDGYPIARGDESPIPVLVMADEYAQPLVDAATHSRRATIDLTAESESPWRYDLRFWKEQRVPESLTYVVRDRDLGKVTARYHADQPGVGTEIIGSRRPYETANTNGVYLPLTMQTERTEYRTAGPGLSWEQEVTGHLADFSPHDLTVNSIATEYRRGQRVTEDWLAQPLHPTAPILTDEAIANGWNEYCPNCRNASSMFLTWADLGDSVPTHWGWSGNHAGEKTTLSLYDAQGNLLGTGKGLRSSLPLAEAEQSYRLVHTYDADVTWRKYAVPQSTVWTFASGWHGGESLPPGYVCGKVGATCEALPLMSVDWDVPVALDNTLRASHQTTLKVRPRHLPGFDLPAVASVKLEASYDGGSSWDGVRTRRASDGWYSAELKVPTLRKTNGAVSLRLSAVDADGNTVTQTLTDAVGLRAPGRH